MTETALRVIESPRFYQEELDLWPNGFKEEAYSLHYCIPFPFSFPAELPAFFINKYSKRGQVVLDPFCGGGTTALESRLSGRVSIASDINPLAIKITEAKLSPADIGEVTLWLQQINLNRPVALSNYHEYFSPFFDIETFREVLNLKALLASANGYVPRFVELLALSLLHGHSAGYFSVYSFPQISISPSEQSRINLRRNQRPDYRAVAPRLLRKAALSLRDGIPSILGQAREKSRCSLSDARDLSYLSSASVDLVVTGPPLPGASALSQDLWMRLWFSCVDKGRLQSQEFQASSLNDWLEFMNEVLLECARVVRPGGRMVIDLRQVQEQKKVLKLDEELAAVVARDLARFWDCECLFLQKSKFPRLRNGQSDLSAPKVSPANRILVLRRR